MRKLIKRLTNKHCKNCIYASEIGNLNYCSRSRKPFEGLHNIMWYRKLFCFKKEVENNGKDI